MERRELCYQLLDPLEERIISWQFLTLLLVVFVLLFHCSSLSDGCNTQRRVNKEKKKMKTLHGEETKGDIFLESL